MEKTGKTERERIIRIVLTVILAGTLLFILLQHRNFLINTSYFNGNRVRYVNSGEIKSVRKEILANHEAYSDEEHIAAKAHTQNYMLLEGSGEVVQPFTAVQARIEQANIYFYNPGSTATGGLIRVYIKDENGSIVADTRLDAAKVSNGSATKLSFTGSTESLNANETAAAVTDEEEEEQYGVLLNKDELYYLYIIYENIAGAEPFGLYLQDGETDAPDMLHNGEVMQGQHIFGVIVFKRFFLLGMMVFVIGIVLGAAVVWIPWDILNRKTAAALKPDGRLHIRYDSILLWAAFLLTPLYDFLLLAKIANMHASAMLELLFSVRGALNIMLLSVITWLFYVIVNRKKAAVFCSATLCMIFGMVNFALLQFRDSPLIAADIVNIKTAMQVSKTYALTLTKPALWGIMLYVVYVCAVISLPEGRGPRWKMRIVNLLIGVLCTAGAWNVMFNSSIIRDNRIVISSFKPRWNYKKNGYMLSFWVTVGMSFVEKPEGYSSDTVERLVASYESDQADQAAETTEKTPNILVIMNESYSDLQANGTFSTNEDYMQFYHSLTENTIKGTIHSSVYGGTTADSEFELLTGFTMKFLPFHSVPFTNLIKSALPTLTYDLKALGYAGNIAFHPGMADSYNRDNTYPLLGFDEHISVENMENPEYVRAYVSDQSDYEEVIRAYEAHRDSTEKDQPFYMFNVTIQNHGSYTNNNGVVDAGITIDEPSLQFPQALNYLNLIKKSDEALEMLISYFSQIDEPTVILMYGDHQPRIDSEFYKMLRSLNQDQSSTIERLDKKYQVGFMLWANFDIPEAEDIDLSINYLSSYLKQTLDLPMTGFDKYMLQLQQTLPVITDICVIDKDGNIYSSEDETPYDDLLLEYQMIQYNGFMDSSHRLDSFFSLKEE